MNRLKELREARNLKQKYLADFLGKTPQAYSLYELGKRNIDNASLVKLAKFFDVTEGYLLGESKQVDLSSSLQVYDQEKNTELIKLLNVAKKLTPRQIAKMTDLMLEFKVS